MLHHTETAHHPMSIVGETEHFCRWRQKKSCEDCPVWERDHSCGDAWRQKGTARYKQVYETIRRGFKVRKEAVIDEKLLRRITVNPEIFGGKPIIRGMRISVELILSLLVQGETPETILTDYPDLEPDDLRACLAYAHAVIAHDKLDSVHISG